MSAPPLGRRLREAVAPVVGAWLIRLLGCTWRLRVVGGEHHDALRAAGMPYIYILWHGELLPLLWAHRGLGIFLLVSEHRDGTLVAEAGKRLGYELVRGSTTRGGARALLEVVSQLKRGNVVGITPDGPRGPKHKFAPGAAVAAQRSGAPLLPIRASADRAWRLHSWDNFLIPKPFARLQLAYGPPTYVTAPDIAGAEREAPALEQQLHATGALIDA